MTNMICLNSGETTRSSKHRESDTAPDVSFVHSSKLDKFTWKTLDMASSDHKPILITYNDEVDIPIIVNDKPRYKWRLEKAKWGQFYEQIEEKLPVEFEDLEVEIHEEKIRSTIIEAAEQHIGKKNITNKNEALFTPEIRDKIKNRNQLRKTQGRAEEYRKWLERRKPRDGSNTRKGLTKRHPIKNYVERFTT